MSLHNTARGRRWPALLLGAGVILAGCGGSEDQAQTPQAPTILRFDSDAVEVDSGGQATLRWEVRGPAGTTVSVDGGGTELLRNGQALQGEIQTQALTQATDFNLVARAGSEVAKAQLKVGVKLKLLKLRYFSTQPKTAKAGEQVIVSWSVEGATQTKLTRDGALVTEVTGAGGGATFTMPEADTTLQLEARGGGELLRKHLIVKAAP